ncbi:choline monooxygenase, chloroplastic [Salvia miltiorrhiza]|uniref:choline monooxygenase, chloroplastic n=1 Tax=Salvia miltiorrhiza TaxID=226208 RepID=UPI0025ACFF28|nr:choline monooxygenase, chloroplastic [Salvia miltiorrhiza]XP_057786328.1 choline monooxygenase, chloroplastic [Salvia miltiorrhiza]XP_057786329.1 choline monooxygenase, chloroplastic [Salvia miltiorrhiza]
MAVKMLLLQKLPAFNSVPERAQFNFMNKHSDQSKSYLDISHRRHRSRQIHNNSNSGGYSIQEFRCGEEMSSSRKMERLVGEFNPEIPVEEAFTPPSSWYTDPDFYGFELDRVFYTGWQAVGYTEQIKEPCNYFTGRLGNIEYIVSRDEEGTLHAFHNVCRHHASLLVAGTGKSSCFACPYHGWTYGLDGSLLKATRITGIKNFKANEMGLVPLKVAIWGPFILINFGVTSNDSHDSEGVGNEWLGDAAQILSANGVDASLQYVCRRTYTLECNWKVFCDNYLDGGYHVPYAHKGLASGLQLDSYSTRMYEKVSVQSCAGITNDSHEENERLGEKAFYAFVYPNFMINRYGPWMDTNLVLPMGPRKCQVIFDYFLEASLVGDSDFIGASLQDSERVQEEDTTLCKGVQQGLESPAYNMGRYSPSIEMAMHHFHCLLHQNLST